MSLIDRFKSSGKGGKVLKELRLQLEWTQKELAQHIDHSEFTISEWENDHPPPPKVVLLYMALLVKLGS